MSSPKSCRREMRRQEREDAIQRIARAIRSSGGHAGELVPGLLAKRLGCSLKQLRVDLARCGVSVPPAGKSWASMVGAPQPGEHPTLRGGPRSYPKGGAE